MNLWVVRTNISDFRRQLETETDADKRRVLEDLLEKERAKLGERPRLTRHQQSTGVSCSVAAKAKARFAAADEQRAVIKSDLRTAIDRAKEKIFHAA